MPSQRPFFLSTVFAAFRQQSPSSLAATSSSQQPNKQTSTTASAFSTSAAAAARSMAASQQSASSSSPSSNGATQQQSQQQQAPSTQSRTTTTSGPIPVPRSGSRRRGSDSSTEGFRNVRGADKWYVGGRTATGEERFFKLGVIRRVRSGDRLSLDRLSL